MGIYKLKVGRRKRTITSILESKFGKKRLVQEARKRIPKSATLSVKKINKTQAIKDLSTALRKGTGKPSHKSKVLKGRYAVINVKKR